MNVRTLEDYHRQLKNAAVFAHRKKKEEMSLRIKEEMIPRLVDLDLELLLQEQKDGINGEFLSYLRRTMLVPFARRRCLPCIPFPAALK